MFIIIMVYNNYIYFVYDYIYTLQIGIFSRTVVNAFLIS